jgi:phosphate-selective porin O/P
MSLFRERARGRAFALGLSIACALTSAPLHAQDSTAAAKSEHALPPMEIRAFVQVWYRTGDPLTKDGFKIRKADLKFLGDLSPLIHWRISVDAAKTLSVSTTTAEISDTAALSSAAIDQKTRMLQEAAVTYTPTKHLSIDVGQQLVPLTIEGWIPLSNLETIERANFISEKSRAVGLGYVYDLGASANGTTAMGIEYHAGVFNEMGDDQNSTDANDQKALMGRLDYHIPLVPGLQLGGSGGYEPGNFTQRKQRFGTDAQYKTDAFTLRAETMAARDGALRRFGWYGLGALRVTRDAQLVARYDSWDRDRTGESTLNNAFERQILLGGTYAIEGTTGKVALNIIHQTFPNISSVRDATFALMAFQASF